VRAAPSAEPTCNEPMGVGTGLAQHESRIRRLNALAVSFSPGRATRVPQVAVTSGIQRTTTVIGSGLLRWALASDLGWGRSPKLHGMQVVTG
jgi:hypothetical protein